jgi:hypothetical protein
MYRVRKTKDKEKIWEERRGGGGGAIALLHHFIF